MYTAVRIRGEALDYQPKISLKSLWEVQSGRNFEMCARFGCDGKATLVSYVQVPNKNRDRYIVPLCESCNAKIWNCLLMHMT